MFRLKLFRKYTDIKFIATVSNLDTIFAVSSGQGRCGVAVIRVSGPQSGSVLRSLTGMKMLPKPRYALLNSIRNPQTGDAIDKGIVLWFPGPKSFTGEDSCELHIHGGIAVINATLKALGSLKNVRLAEPGEFSKRAFYNGKLDLTAVEGIADLMAAETDVQRKQAYFQTEGYLRKVYEDWRSILVKCVAQFEAYLDFGETDNLETNLINELTETVDKLTETIKQHLHSGRKGERLRNGIKTVILGEPNVGKSSLLNVLCQRPAAIVTPLAGTTRDVLEVTLDIGGYPLVLADTAGLRSQAVDIVEKEGIQKALNAYEASDLVLLVIDSLKYLEWCKLHSNIEFFEFIKSYTVNLNIHNLINTKDTFHKECIVIANKIDLINTEDMCKFENLNVNLISCKSETGIEVLLKQIEDKLKFLCGEPSKEHPSMTHARHRQHLDQCVKHLERFLYLNRNCFEGDVLVAEELRKALRQIGKIVGIVTTEQLLDAIFKDFCIGK